MRPIITDAFGRSGNSNQLDSRTPRRGVERFGKTHAGLKVINFVPVSENLEDEQTVSCLMDTAQQAGFRSRWSDVEKIGCDSLRQTFVSAAKARDGGGTMVSCFKLYPWDWLFREAFGESLAQAATTWIEPPWKSLFSNQGLLALAWPLPTQAVPSVSKLWIRARFGKF